MGDLVYTWATQLVFLVLFVTVVEMLLPAGDLRRYAKMILGLAVILTVMDPLLRFVQGPQWADPLVDTYTGATLATDAVQAGRKLSSHSIAVGQRQILAEARERIGALDGVATAVVEVVGREPQVTLLTMATADTDDVKKQAERIVREVVGTDATVTVKVEQGGQ